MKKMFVLLLIVLFISGCSNETDNWNSVNVSNVGSFKVPQEWEYNEQDDIVYFADKKVSDETTDLKMYIIGILFDDSVDLEKLSEFYGKEISYKELVSSEVFSNSAIVGKKKYLIDDKSCEKMFIDLCSSDKYLFLLVVDDSIDYNTIVKIGKSFKQGR